MTMLQTAVAHKKAVFTNDNLGAPLAWAQQDPLLRDMWANNASPEEIAERLRRSVAAIMTRAARLGLPRRAAPGRKPLSRDAKATRTKARRAAKIVTEDMLRETSAAGGIARAMRSCLMCVNAFQSHGAHNRICPKCKGSPDFESGSRLGDAEYLF